MILMEMCQFKKKKSLRLHEVTFQAIRKIAKYAIYSMFCKIAMMYNQESHDRVQYVWTEKETFLSTAGELKKITAILYPKQQTNANLPPSRNESEGPPGVVAKTSLNIMENFQTEVTNGETMTISVGTLLFGLSLFHHS